MIKKVQIRSFVKGGNHGQYLQALGLRTLVEQLLPEAQVTHLDYENHYWKELKIQTIGGMLPKFISMRYFWKKNLDFSQFTDQTDVSVYGSDMIWHMDSNLFPTDRKMFGYNDSAVYKVAYAPSVGYRINNEPTWVGGMLDDFVGIGVRDRQTESLVKDHSMTPAKLVIDPCFHLIDSRFADWFKGQKRENFVSVYSGLNVRLVAAFLENLKLNRLPKAISNIKYLGYFHIKKFIQELPKQFTDPMWTVQQIARSRLLLTSTFHGVMIALMTNTPFIAIDSPNLNARLDSPIANAFSSKRIMTIHELAAFENQQMDELISNDDLKLSFINSYIVESRNWLGDTLKVINNENRI